MTNILTEKDFNNDKLVNLMRRYEKEQRDFDNHWLWQELKTTPKEFFRKVDDYVKTSGIDIQIWQQKLAAAKQSIMVRVRERDRIYTTMNFKKHTGIKA